MLAAVPDDWFPLIPREELVPMVRAPGVVTRVQLGDPDVAGLQEFAAGTESASYIEAHLPDYTWLHSSDNHALLVRTSRFTVVERGERKLNTVNQEGSLLDRYADWARVRERSSGRTLLVLNVHAHPVQNLALAGVRSLAIQRLVTVIGELDPGLAEPLVLLGDFNASSAEKRPVFRDHLALLRTAGIVDARTLAAGDSSDVFGAASLHQMVAKVAGRDVAKVVRRNGRHVDYVWVPKGVKVSTWRVLSGPGLAWHRVQGERVPIWTGIIPSDHSPVVADLRFG
ncbi:MAG: endonuclease/exonuclease/phosphatase family protein [Propionicimonas sp.]